MTMNRTCRSAIAHHGDLLLYDFGPYHPLRPERITAGLDLLERAALWSPQHETITPTVSPRADLETVHDSDYVRAVDDAGSAHFPRGELARFGFSSSDNPPFPAMHHAASLVSGAAVEAVRRVMNGDFDHAFSPAGGLHHALRARASGFCIYNDPAVAAAVLLRDFGVRVFYVDFDCHHGDGVQWIFYRDPTVMTVSFHETGRFLFPGTGDVTERGEGPGLGYAVNVPFAPFTQDEQWLHAVQTLLPPLVERFRPDVIISNHGCDTHQWDPLTHLSLTTLSFGAQARLVHDLAHAYCHGRLVAVGSGGYDWRRVVPRSWSIIWSTLTGRELPAKLPSDWRTRWSSEPDEPMPETFLDAPDLISPAGRDADVERLNQETLTAALHVADLA
jgi:acetoin utilization protein AcuC